jgi:hypothetical protein
MDAQTYFLHADDWGMIELIPKENQDVARKALAAGDLFTRPEYVYVIGDRGLSLAELGWFFDGAMIAAGQLISGTTRQPELIEDGFAWFDPDFGAIYGTAVDGQVVRLYFHNTVCDCGADFEPHITGLLTLARTFNLILVDWFVDEIVSFNDQGDENALRAYVEEG